MCVRYCFCISCLSFSYSSCRLLFSLFCLNLIYRTFSCLLSFFRVWASRFFLFLCCLFQSGATVHFVDKGSDTGPIVLQKAVEVHDDDTPKVLQQRIMEQAEWVILPEVIDWIAMGYVKVEEGIVKVDKSIGTE